MKLVVVRSPKLLTGLFRIIFRISKEDMAEEKL
ncbi:MAG: stage V sporulation protein SpoVM [Oscillospiraceae bacterium]|nr:stage V sporulation protein SpoVM [Oscillospiraceae bacterium]